MPMSVSEPRTRILALTGEAELCRLLRSILEPGGCKVVAGDLPTGDVAASDPADIVIVDLEPFDLKMAGRVRRAYPDAEILALCGTYREADCIAVVEMDVDYLPRPFPAQDLMARVRVAELRRLRAAGRGRFYRRGPFVIDLLVRRVIVEGRPLPLARSELAILMRLANRAGHLATFREILAGLGRADTARGRRMLNMSIFRLRRRIERNPSRPEILLTEAESGTDWRRSRTFGRFPTSSPSLLALRVPRFDACLWPGSSWPRGGRRSEEKRCGARSPGACRTGPLGPIFPLGFGFKKPLRLNPRRGPRTPRGLRRSRSGSRVCRRGWAG